MKMWQTKMQEFFALALETKEAHPHEGDTNLGYSIMGAENVDPTAPKDLKELPITITQECPTYGRYSGFTASALDSRHV